MILDDRLPFIQWHDFLLMLDGQLVHFPAPKSHNAKDIVFKIDRPVCISPKKQLLLAQKFTWWQGERDWHVIDDGRELENFPFSCPNSSQKAKEDLAM